jgi:two-component system nitrate/nitrite response regulator NarL
MTGARVVVADPSPILRAGLRTLLEREGAVVAEAADLGELRWAAELGQIDVAVVDLGLPPHGARGALERLSRLRGLGVIVWSLEPRGEDILAALEGGALGFARKDAPPEHLLALVRRVRFGQAALAPELVGRFVEAARDRGACERASARASALSLRERRVLELASDGLRNRQIASMLGLSEFTVKRHVQNILHKLGLASREEASALYRLAATIRAA